MTAKARSTAFMNLYQEIHHAARENKPGTEILRLCRLPLTNMMASDTDSGPECASSADVLIALWSVAARLNAAERHVETLKRKLRRDKHRTGGKPQGELLKKDPEEMTAEQENTEAFLHALEKND